MQRATYVRIHGDKPIGDAIAGAMETRAESLRIMELEKELGEARLKIRQLEAQLNITSYVRSKEYREKIDELNRKYAVRHHSKLYDKMLVLVGMLWLIHTEGEIS